MNAYPVAGLVPLRTNADIFGLSGVEAQAGFDGFAVPSMITADEASPVDIGSAELSSAELQQYVADVARQRVREKLGRTNLPTFGYRAFLGGGGLGATKATRVKPARLKADKRLALATRQQAKVAQRSSPLQAKSAKTKGIQQGIDELVRSQVAALQQWAEAAGGYPEDRLANLIRTQGYNKALAVLKQLAAQRARGEAASQKKTSAMALKEQGHQEFLSQQLAQLATAAAASGYPQEQLETLLRGRGYKGAMRTLQQLAAKKAKLDAKAYRQVLIQTAGTAGAEAAQVDAGVVPAGYYGDSGTATAYGYEEGGEAPSEEYGEVSPLLLAPAYSSYGADAPVAFPEEEPGEGESDVTYGGGESLAMDESGFGPGGGNIAENEEPNAPIPSEGEPEEGEADEEFSGGGMFGVDDGIGIPSLPDAGLPRGVRLEPEDEGAPQAFEQIDRMLRPSMLSEQAHVGFPYAGGGATPFERRSVNGRVEILDPSVVELDEEDIVGRYGVDMVDFMDPSKMSGLGGFGDFGQLPTAKDSAVAAANVALSSVAVREGQLQQYSQNAYDAFMAAYATLRNSVNTTFTALSAAPDFDLGKSMTLSAQITLYRQALDSAISQAKPKPVAKKPRPTTMVRALPAAVKETVFSKYGLYVLGGGALLIGGLLALNMMTKRRGA